MAWIDSYVSYGGRFAPAIPVNDFPLSFEQVSGAEHWGSLYNPDTGFNPRQYDGWEPGIETYPINEFILRSEDGTYVVLQATGQSSAQYGVGSSSSGPWTYTSILASPQTGTWKGIFKREVNGKIYLGMLTFYQFFDNSWGAEWAALRITDLEEDYGAFDAKEISPEYGEASGPGGYDGGTFDDSSDTIGVPTMPTIGVSSIGFVNVYNPSTGALASLGEDLFPDFTPINPYSPTGDTVIDAITDVAEALANIAQNIPNAIEMFNNSQLINYIIDCHIIPVTPTVSGSQAIKIGYRTMSQAAPKVTSDYVDCDCGSLNIGEYYRNFIDYGPYTQAKLFLPFVGFVPIEPELFQSGVLKVVYRFNVIDGSFMAFVLSTSSKSRLSNTVIGQWGGNACVHIPITGVNYSNMVSGIAAGASAVVAEIGKGSLIGAADAALNTAAAAPALQSSNGYNATTSFLSVRTPYLVIERSVSHYSKDYGHEQGYPSEITADWSKLSGYTESDAIHLEGLGATEEETKEIASLLAAGVIL